jgi:putative transposase
MGGARAVSPSPSVVAKDFEQTIASATAWLFLASVRLLARRIARLAKSDT